MAKGKLQKFAEMETFSNVFQFPYSWFLESGKEQSSASETSSPDAEHQSVAAPCLAKHPMAGNWRAQYFRNDNPIVLELGCGKGEYTVGLARRYPDVNVIGVDIKGSRMYKGAKEALDGSLSNAAFLRTNIEIIDRFFAEGEVQEIWLTFSDPQMKNPRKRLTSTYFMERYRRFLVDNGIIHLKTDSNFLFTYTGYMAEKNRLPVEFQTDDLYGISPSQFSILNSQLREIQTYYEQMWIERGLNIKYMKFRLPHDLPLVEPDVEIELDDYRSYKRDKRSSLTVSK